MMSIQNLVLFCQLVLKINKILTSIKARNSVASLRKTKIYNTNVDSVNDNVYSKFGLNLSIRSQDIEQKLIKAFMHVLVPTRTEIKLLDCSEDFSHNKSMGIFPDAQGQLTLKSLV